MKAYDRLPRFQHGYIRRLRPDVPLHMRPIDRKRRFSLPPPMTRRECHLQLYRNWLRRTLSLSRLSRTAHEKVRPK